jgi:flagellar hook-length control protein FliK
MTIQTDFNLKSIISQLAPGGPVSGASAEAVEPAGTDFEALFRQHNERQSGFAAFATLAASGKSGDDIAELEDESAAAEVTKAEEESPMELQTLSLLNGRLVLTSRFEVGIDEVLRAWYSDLQEDEVSARINSLEIDQSVSATRAAIQDSIHNVIQESFQGQSHGSSNSLVLEQMSGNHQSATNATLPGVGTAIPIDTAGRNIIADTGALTGEDSGTESGLAFTGSSALAAQEHARARSRSDEALPKLAGSNAESTSPAATSASSMLRQAELTTAMEQAEKQGQVLAEADSQLKERLEDTQRLRELLPAWKHSHLDTPTRAAERMQMAASGQIKRTNEKSELLASLDLNDPADGLESDTDFRGQALEGSSRVVEKSYQTFQQAVVSLSDPGLAHSASEYSGGQATDRSFASQMVQESRLAGGPALQAADTAAPATPSSRDITYRFTDAATFSRDMQEFVAEIIRDGSGSVEKQIRIRLFPENLGQIDATISETNEGLHVQLVAETAQIARLLRDGNSLLKDMLANGNEVQVQVDVAGEQQAGNASAGGENETQSNSALSVNEEAENTDKSNQVTVSSTGGLDTYV